MSAADGDLVVTAGADAVWRIEDVSAKVAGVVARYWTASPPLSDDLSIDVRAVVEHLAALGAVRPSGVDVAPGKLGYVVVGDPCPEFRASLWARRENCLDGVAGGDGLTVVVRTNAPLRSLLPLAAELRDADAPHVLCDLAFHQTVVIGPHVFPGDTACLACLAGRVGNRWGDPDPPLRPAVSRRTAAELAALLVVQMLGGAGAGAAPRLTNATVAFDLQTFGSIRESLWRVPSCPVCGDWPNDGRLRP